MGVVIAVEGLPGSGKTTFVQAMARRFRLRPIFEPVPEYLSEYYEDPQRYAVLLQFDMLMRRFGLHELAAVEAAREPMSGGVLLDRSLLGDFVIAKRHHCDGNFSELEWGVYRRHFLSFLTRLPPVHAVVFLDVSPRVAHERILDRARPAERGISIQWLERLYFGYAAVLQRIGSGRLYWPATGIQHVPWCDENGHESQAANVFRQLLCSSDCV